MISEPARNDYSTLLSLDVFFLLLLARKSNQNACDLLKGDFFFREVEAAKEKPPVSPGLLSNRSNILTRACPAAISTKDHNNN
ncbi:MAG: hypothetical protein ACXVNQ_09875 [Bacteroidia bacterium]